MGYTHVHRSIGKPSRVETISKNVLIILNTIFVVFGFILFVYGCGGKASTNREAYVAITENGGDIFQVTSNVLVVLGLILLGVGFWGLFGIHTCMKASIYVSLLIILAFMDISLGLYSSRIESNAKVTVESNLLRTITILKSNQDPSDPSISTIRSSWEALQSELRCCGVYDYRDWFFTSATAHRRIDVSDNNVDPASPSTERVSPGTPDSEDFMRIPHACFKNGNDGLDDADFNTPISTDIILENIIKDGCLGKTVTDLDIDRIQRVGVLMAVSKILAVICAIIVSYHLRHDKIILHNYA